MSRYLDADLQELKAVTREWLGIGQHELAELTLLTSNLDGMGDISGAYKTLEDGSATLEKEQTNILAVRQQKFIEQLQAALVRIEDKTYGICRVTGRLIPKERLRAVPHTTMSIEAKLKQ